MGRVTIFSTGNNCIHCKRAKGALMLRKIPHEEINLELFPHRRSDMLSLSDQFSVPQVFFNAQYIGGADELVAVLEERDQDPDQSPYEWYQTMIAEQPDPDDPRLALPSSSVPITNTDDIDEDEDDDDDDDDDKCIRLPNGEYTTVLDTMSRLDRVLDSADRPYNAHWYKNCFINTEGVQALMKEFSLTTSEEAVAFGKYLQQEHHLLDHVCGDHEFRDDGYYFFRLQCYQQPHVLNSFCIWTTKTAKKQQKSGMDILKAVKRRMDTILNQCTDNNGLVDYVGAKNHERFLALEHATCELQVVDMAQMDETTRKAFGLNLYNLFITYAFIKTGIGTTSIGRGAFFNNTKMNIGGQLLCFNDLEHGILRANTKHPYAIMTLGDHHFHDPQLVSLALTKLDPRIHFGLYCGAKSCPPVRYFRPESLEEELRVVALSFCEKDDVVHLNEDQNEITVSMLFKWYERDFCESRDLLPSALLPFLKGSKQATLQRMIDQQHQSDPNNYSKKPISILYRRYDWSANASRFEPYNTSNLKANECSPGALLRSTLCFG